MRFAKIFGVLLVVFATFPFVRNDSEARSPGQGGNVGSSKLVTFLPAEPGFPEGVVVVGHLAFVTVPAVFGNAGAPVSRIYVVNVRTNKLVDEIVIQSQDPAFDHGISGITADAIGRLYVTAIPGGVLRIDPVTGTEEVYAVIPDVPPPFPFIPDLPPLPNDLAFDVDGTLYVTDTLQGIIWKVPLGAPGGVAQVFLENPVWIGDPAACGPAGCVGLNGIRFGLDGLIYFIVSAIPEGFIYRVPANGTLADVELFVGLPAGQGPDGLAFGVSGRLYVTMVFANEIAVYDTDGVEVDRFVGPIKVKGQQTIPYDAPAVLAFDRRWVVVVNHALLTGNPDNFALFRVFVNEFGFPLNEPMIP